MNAAILLIVMALCGLLMLASIIYLVWGLIQALLWKMDTWRFRRKLELECQRPKVAADSPRDVRLNEFVHELDEAVGYSLNGDFGMVQYVRPPPYEDDAPRGELMFSACVGLAAQIDMPVRWNGFDREDGIKRLKKVALPLAKKYDLLNGGQLDLRAMDYHIGWYARLHSMIIPIVMIKVTFSPSRILRCSKIEACKGLASVVLKDYFNQPIEDVLKSLLRQTADSLTRFRGLECFDKLMETPVFGQMEEDGHGVLKKGWPVADAYQNRPHFALDDLYWD